MSGWIDRIKSLYRGLLARFKRRRHVTENQVPRTATHQDQGSDEERPRAANQTEHVAPTEPPPRTYQADQIQEVGPREANQEAVGNLLAAGLTPPPDVTLPTPINRKSRR